MAQTEFEMTGEKMGYDELPINSMMAEVEAEINGELDGKKQRTKHYWSPKEEEVFFEIWGRDNWRLTKHGKNTIFFARWAEEIKERYNFDLKPEEIQMKVNQTRSKFRSTRKNLEANKNAVRWKKYDLVEKILRNQYRPIDAEPIPLEALEKNRDLMNEFNSSLDNKTTSVQENGDVSSEKSQSQQGQQQSQQEQEGVDAKTNALPQTSGIFQHTSSVLLNDVSDVKCDIKQEYNDYNDFAYQQPEQQQQQQQPQQLQTYDQQVQMHQMQPSHQVQQQQHHQIQYQIAASQHLHNSDQHIQQHQHVQQQHQQQQQQQQIIHHSPQQPTNYNHNSTNFYTNNNNNSNNHINRTINVANQPQNHYIPHITADGPEVPPSMVVAPTNTPTTQPYANTNSYHISDLATSMPQQSPVRSTIISNSNGHSSNIAPSPAVVAAAPSSSGAVSGSVAKGAPAATPNPISQRKRRVPDSLEAMFVEEMRKKNLILSEQMEISRKRMQLEERKVRLMQDFFPKCLTLQEKILQKLNNA